MPVDWTSRVWTERGQALPLLLVSLLGTMAIVAMTLAVGQAVNRRSGLQLLADAGAYTGASNMAVGLNALARVNRELIVLWRRTEPVFTNGVPCGVSDRAMLAYDRLAADLGTTYERLNRRWQAHPSGEAGRVTHYNLYDLFPGEPHGVFRMSETDRALGLVRQRDARVLVTSTRIRQRKTWVCTNGIEVEPRVHTFALHFRKADRAVMSFAWVVRSPAGTPMLGARLFGPRAIPAMGAAAVAKPVGGSIEDGRPTYITKMVPLASVGVRRVFEGGAGVRRPVTH